MAAPPAAPDVQLVPVTDLERHPDNPRQGDVGAIIQSIEAHGFYGTIIAQASSRRVLAGNHRLEAARQLGIDAVPVIYLDVDDQQAQRILLVDNRTNDLATYDDTALTDLLQQLMPDLSGTGFDASDLDELLAELDPGERKGTDTTPIEPPADPTTKPGDLWILGDHRLVCGSSTDPTAVERVLAGDRPDILATDPPYGVAYVGKTDDALTIKNDAGTPEQTRDLFRDALAISGLKPGGVFYATVPDGPLSRWFIDAVEQGLGADALRQQLVWVKDRFVMGRSDYHYRHEPILYGWATGAAHYFIDDRTQDSIWEIPRPSASREHPTMKPVPLFERMLDNSSKPHDIVYEPFGGSGTTLLAADNLHRRARVIELDPAYCDVIIDRWQRHTGQTATLEAP